MWCLRCFEDDFVFFLALNTHNNISAWVCTWFCISFGFYFYFFSQKYHEYFWRYFIVCLCVMFYHVATGFLLVSIGFFLHLRSSTYYPLPVCILLCFLCCFWSISPNPSGPSVTPYHGQNQPTTHHDPPRSVTRDNKSSRPSTSSAHLPPPSRVTHHQQKTQNNPPLPITTNHDQCSLPTTPSQREEFRFSQNTRFPPKIPVVDHVF